LHWVLVLVPVVVVVVVRVSLPDLVLGLA